MGPDASLSPEDISAQSFTSAFRGYDTAEVKAYLGRVATELKAWQDRADNLESAWHSAEERAARPPVLDEDTLMAAVGEETAAILRTARASAAEMRTKASEESARLVAEAQEKADRLTTTAAAEAELMIANSRATSEQMLGDARAEADSTRAEAMEVLTAARAEAEAEAAALMAAAQAEATATIEKARAEAEETRAEADKERRLTIEGAHATRDRILDDLTRRRRIATVQIEQLRAGRERLAESYAVVRRTLEEVQNELSRADAEARSAADEVGRRLKDDPEPELTEDHRSPAAPSEPASSAVDELFARIRSTPKAAEPKQEAGAAGPDEQTVEEVVAVLETAAVDEPPAEPGPTEPPPEPALTEPAPEQGPADPPAGADAKAESKKGRAGRRRPGAGETPEEAQAPVPAPAPSVEAPTADGPTADAPTVEASGSEGESAVADEDEALLQRRDEAVSDLEVALTRRLKRALQDEQNDVLDRLRNLSGKSGAGALLATVEEQTARYVDASKPLLADAASAGADFAAQILGSSLGDLEVAVDDLALECGTSIVGPLRRRLELAIGPGAGDDQAVLVEAIGAAYREWKTQRIELMAGDVLSSAFSRGTWQTLPPSGSARWVVCDTDGPCPDCDDDALAGDVPRSESFPTGQRHPPAHSGCRCLLVPLS